MMLCGVSVVFNSLGDVLGLMSCKRSSENGQVLVGFQSTEAFGCLSIARVRFILFTLFRTTWRRPELT
jgi:hypothetical protein